jgi:hypothetical protein
MERLFRLLGLRYSPDGIHNSYAAIQSGDPERVTPAYDCLDSLLERDLKRLVMAPLDSLERIAMHARDLLLAGDSWRAVCAISTAAEWKLRGLAAEIALVTERGERETVAVARAGSIMLA